MPGPPCGRVRASWVETMPGHADPALRPRAYERPWREVFDACARAAGELDTLVLAEADPRRGTVGCYVRLAPLWSLPVLGPRKHPHARGLGWFQRFEPALSRGWLQVRVDPGPKGTAVVSAHARLELPLARPLAALLLKNYLRWLDIRLGEPRRA
jgi:hypothetical protein